MRGNDSRPLFRPMAQILVKNLTGLFKPAEIEDPHEVAKMAEPLCVDGTLARVLESSFPFGLYPGDDHEVDRSRLD
jgi:hypothetical protein